MLNRIISFYQEGKSAYHHCLSLWYVVETKRQNGAGGSRGKNRLLFNSLKLSRQDNLAELGAMKIQAKIQKNKQLKRYDEVLAEITGKEEIELKDVEEIRSTNEERIPTQDEQKVAPGKEKDEDKPLNTKTGVEVVENDDDTDNYKAKSYDFGFLHSKLIKNIIFCLKESQQTGEKVPFITN